ncbi:MAG TPA: glycosyltransferase family 4 protein [Flavobacteriales bacterium]|nr:glycosyltransferase family 4 protein [Flavobacteriales bacterium]
MNDALARLKASSRPIAFAHYSLVNDISGVTTWLQDLLFRLNADGVPLVVLLHHIGDGIEHSSLVGPLRAAGIHVELHPRSATIQEDIRGTLRFLEEHRPAVFLPQCLNAMYFAAAEAGAHGLPWLLTMHSDDPDYWEIAEALPPEEHGGNMVCVSDYIAGLASKRGLAKAPQVIPYGVEVPAAVVRSSTAPFRVVYSGRMVEEQKRLSLVVDTMIEACERDERIECVLMGQGPAEAKAKEVVRNAGFEDRILFKGRLAGPEVRAVLERSQALLLMSDYEGLPVSMLEAMALGVVPVVRGIDSGIPELVHHGATGLITNAVPSDAATSLVQLMNDEPLWHRCSQGARALVQERYSIGRSYADWVERIARSMEKSTWDESALTLERLAAPALGTRLAKGYKRVAPQLDAPKSWFDRLKSLVRRGA